MQNSTVKPAEYILGVLHHVFVVPVLRNFMVKCATDFALNYFKVISNIAGVFLSEPRCEKTGLRGFRSSPTQTRLYKHTRWLEA